MRPEDRFGGRARDYARARPGYPPQVIECLRTHAGLRPGAAVADLGCGTGIFSALLLDAGAAVYGVEPNAAMLDAARAAFAERPAFVPVEARAEATGLPAASVDLATAAQAFHWFDAAAARAEFRRILRPGGHVALVWNERRDDTSDFLREYEAMLRRCGTDYAHVDHRNVTPERMQAFFAPEPMQTFAFEHVQELDRGGFFARTLSCSYVPAAGQPGHAALLEALGALFARRHRNGRVVIDYTARLYLGTL